MLTQSKLSQEIKGNLRLQWLLVAVLCILVLSLSRFLLDSTAPKLDEATRQALLLSRLTNTINNPVSDDAYKELQKKLEATIQRFPVSASQSVAEAGALSSAEEDIATLFKDGRVDIVGSQVIPMGQRRFWEVRLKVEGRMDSLKLIQLLEYFDGDSPNRRLISMQYRPKAADVVTIVYDVLYLQGDK